MTQISKDIQDELDGNRQSEKNDECFKTGETNTINFVKADGLQQMFPYSQLITAWTEHTDEENVIKIFFATHLVTVKGYNLINVYKALQNQKIISIFIRTDRYLKNSGKKFVFIKEINTIWKNPTYLKDTDMHSNADN